VADALRAMGFRHVEIDESAVPIEVVRSRDAAMDRDPAGEGSTAPPGLAGTARRRPRTKAR
jgi:hypothetical protein